MCLCLPPVLIYIKTVSPVSKVQEILALIYLQEKYATIEKTFFLVHKAWKPQLATFLSCEFTGYAKMIDKNAPFSFFYIFKVTMASCIVNRMLA